MVKSYVLCWLVQPGDVAAVFGRYVESEPLSAASRSTFSSFAGICAVALGAAVALIQIEYKHS